MQTTQSQRIFWELFWKIYWTCISFFFFCIYIAPFKSRILFKNINHHTLTWYCVTVPTDWLQAHNYHLAERFLCTLKESQSQRGKRAWGRKVLGGFSGYGKFFPNVGTSEAEASSMPALGTQHRPWRAKPKQLKQTRHEEREGKENTRWEKEKTKIMFHNQKQN